MATKPLSDLTATWNSAGTTFNAIKMNVTDTASAAGSLLMDLQVGGSSKFSVRKDGYTAVVGPQLALSSTGSYFWAQSNSGGFRIGGAADVALERDAADTLAQRRGTNAQTFRIYNTFTDASNYERVSAGWSGNVISLLQESAGTGSARQFKIGTSGNSALTFRVSGTDRWSVMTTGHILAEADNTYDIGASGANRPRNLFLGGTATINGQVVISDGQAFLWTSRALIRSPADGVMRLSNNLETDFNRLQFGGTTSSFPSLKRNATALETKLADDSAYAPHAMQFLDVTDGITAPAAATGRARIYVDTADGDLKVVFADGTIKTIVTDT